MSKTKIIAHIERKLVESNLVEKLSKTLTSSELNSLLMAVYEEKAAAKMPKDLLRVYEQNPYVQMSNKDADAFAKLALELFALAEKKGISPVMLSPAAILGSCSALGTVSQNKIVSALRDTEILADPTNMMAIHLANEIKKGERNTREEVKHIAAVNRVLRVQPHFEKHHYAHFGLFSMVSTGIDTGSYECERALLKKHLGFYLQFLGKDIWVTVQARQGYTDIGGFMQTMEDLLVAYVPKERIMCIEPDMENAYYKGLNIKMYWQVEGEKLEVGDIGFVDWTQKLLANKKERCLISAIGLDRLL